MRRTRMCAFRSQRFCPEMVAFLVLSMLLSDVVVSAFSGPHHSPSRPEVPSRMMGRTLQTRNFAYYYDEEEEYLEYEDEDSYNLYYERSSVDQKGYRNDVVPSVAGFGDNKDALSFSDEYDSAGKPIRESPRMERRLEDAVESRGGNFWINPEPPAAFDPETDRRRQSRRRETSPSRSEERRSPPTRRRTPVRTGEPRLPPPVSDFYNRLFWFGFDPTETTDAKDKTMFGGTRGKFNGLAYVGSQDRDDIIKRRRPRSVRRDESWAEDEYEPDRFVRDEDMDWRGADSYRSVTPPYDPPFPRREPINSRQRSRRSGRDWVTNEVSGWFDDNYAGSSEYRPTSRRQQRRDSGTWSPWNALDIFLGIDREDFDEEAELYSRRMGIESEQSRSRGTKRRRRPTREYDVDIEETDIGIMKEDDIDSINEFQDDVIDADVVVETDRSKKQDLTWEERSLAIERVPPADIPAWGPTGELNIDARSKAISDALEDINSSRQNVDEKLKAVEKAREHLSILRVDSELLRKRLKTDTGSRSSRMLQESYRSLGFEIEEADRALRFATIRLEAAEEELSEIENRHWAVLSFYDAGKASEEIKAAFKEFNEANAVEFLAEDSRPIVTPPDGI